MPVKVAETLLALHRAGGCATTKQAAELLGISERGASARLRTAARRGLVEKHLVGTGSRGAVAVWCLPGASPGKIFAAAWRSVSKINYRHVARRLAEVLRGAKSHVYCISTTAVLPEDASVLERVVLFEIIKSLDGYGVKAGRLEKWCVREPRSAAEQVLRWMKEAAAPPPPIPRPRPRQEPRRRKKKRKARHSVSVEVRLPRVFKRLAGASARELADDAVAWFLSAYDGQPPPKPQLPRPLWRHVVVLSPALYEALRESAEEWGWSVEEAVQTALWLYAAGV